jgi:hypothetical protein
MDDQTKPELPAPVPANRLPYDAELFKQSEEFCRNLLAAVPEIGAVAIVPVWQVPPENIPPALLRFRNPAETPMAAILQLLKTLANFSQNLNRELLGQFQMFDNYAKELAEKIQQNEEKLQSQNPQQ